jgi:outer membrane protein OmpA-like peptidoglycan-associated protein
MSELFKLFPAPTPARMRLASVGAAILLSALGSGCSSVPDSLNPVKWYEGVDAVVNPPEDPVADYGKDQPYPNLATVPARPATPPAAERAQIATGLVADRTNANYTEDTIRREVDPATPLPPPSFNRTTPRQQVADAPLAPGQPSAVVGGQAAPVQGYYPTQAAGQPVPTGYVNGNANLLTGPAPTASAATAERTTKPVTARPTETLPNGPLPAPGGVPNQPVQQAYASPGGHSSNPSAQVATIYFGGGAVLGLDDKSVLRQVADLYRLQGGHLRVIGHASAGASPASIKQSVTNLRIAGERADAVANELIRLGVPGASIVRNADTTPEPSYDPNSEEGKAAGRRVEIYLDY